MSRRYPVRDFCPTCQRERAFKEDGTPRQHACWVQWTGEPVPWPYLNSRVAARKLGVSIALVEGLVNSGNGRLRGVKIVRLADVGAADAESRVVLNRADVEAMAEAFTANR